MVLFNKVQVPHYNYVGDSILGYKSHMGAGSITSNVKSDKKLVVVKTPEGNIETGMKKFGAMLGDHVEVGCGTILNPGSVVGPHTNIYPLSSVRGFVPGGTECYNTCFALSDGNRHFLVDTGGGNRILKVLKDTGIQLEDIHDIFITHEHIDHLLGVIWLIRMIGQKKIGQGKYEGNLRIYCHDGLECT